MTDSTGFSDEVAVRIVVAGIVPTITGAAWQGASGFALTAVGGAGQSYILQAASNLVAPILWAPLLTNQADPNGVVGFIDPQATNQPRRFYRLTMP